MTTITVHIDNQQDLTEISEVLTRLGVAYEVKQDEWGNLIPAEIEGINAGLEDIDAGHIYTNDEVQRNIADKLNNLRSSNDR